MRFTRHKPTASGRFNMTPMIDVVLQLVIFFMYTSQFAQLARTSIDLPEQPGLERLDGPDSPLIIDVRASGEVLIAGDPAGPERMARLLTVESARYPDPSLLEVLVRADRQTPAEHINRIAAALREIGVTRWKLGTASTEVGP